MVNVLAIHSTFWVISGIDEKLKEVQRDIAWL